MMDDGSHILEFLASSDFALHCGRAQFFIISCKVDDTTYVPCVYALLPGKSKTGYLTMFQLVRRALNSHRLTLASEWMMMMSDFEFNIRSAFADVFPNITIEGCSFHWAKFIIVKVHRCGFKPTL